MGAGRPGRAELRRRLQRHLPDRRGQPGALPVRGLAHHDPVCGRRRAAGQGARSARPAAPAAQDRGVRHGGPAQAGRPGRDRPGRPARAGPRAQRAEPRRGDGARPGLPTGRPGHPGLHLGHHRQAQGRHAQPRRPGLHRARLQHAGLADEHDECMCFLPLCHIAERMGGEYFRCTPAPSSTSSRTRRPCPRTCARSRPRCSPPCPGCGRSSIPA